MSTYRYCVLQCDACQKPLGRSSDPEHPARGITICTECWANPIGLPRHLKSTIALDQVRNLGSTDSKEKP